MLSLVCRDVLGNKIAECHHVHPQLLWTTILGVFCDYYQELPDSIMMGPNSTISKNGLELGTAEVVSNPVVREDQDTGFAIIGKAIEQHLYS